MQALTAYTNGQNFDYVFRAPKLFWVTLNIVECRCIWQTAK